MKEQRLKMLFITKGNVEIFMKIQNKKNFDDFRPLEYVKKQGIIGAYQFFKKENKFFYSARYFYIF